MRSERSVMGQALSVVSILVLGLLYVLLLSLGTIALTVKGWGTSVWSAGGSFGRRLVRSPSSGR